MTSDLLTQKLCDRLRNLCLIEAKLKNCWTKALASKVACSYLRDMYRQQKLTRICLKKIHTDTHTTRKDTHTHTHTFLYSWASLIAQKVKSEECACNEGDLDSMTGSGRSPGEENGKTLQHSCLEDPHGRRSLAGYSPLGRKEAAEHAVRHA